jgi:hypothetical protein
MRKNNSNLLLLQDQLFQIIITVVRKKFKNLYAQITKAQRKH